MTVRFLVEGVCQPKGSMRGFRTAGGVHLTSTNPGLKGWERQVREAASGALVGRRVEGEAGGWPVDVGYRVWLGVWLPAPKTIPAARKGCPMVKPDVDKLARGVLDGLTGVLWTDDAQVLHLTVAKNYTRGGPHVEVRVDTW